ncbi:MAG: tetratricopeptide repeat protein [Limisphaerales bacterium]
MLRLPTVPQTLPVAKVKASTGQSLALDFPHISYILAIIKLTPITWLAFGALLCLLAPLPALAAATNAPPADTTNGVVQPSRLTVAIIDFENQTGDTAADFWGSGLYALIHGALRHVKAVRVMPADAVSYALRQLHQKSTDPVEVAWARRLGELIEARRVIWGDYRRQGKQWQVRVRVLNVATGQVSQNLSASSGDWFEIRDRLDGRILEALGVKPTQAESQEMQRRRTGPSAFESLTKARSLGDEGKDTAQAERWIRSALEADPQCAEAYIALASVKAEQGKVEEADKAARQALKLDPDLPAAHYMLAWALSAGQKYQEAEAELRAAAKIDPDDARTFESLAWDDAAQGLEDKALDNFNRALQLNRFRASVHAQVACLHARHGDREQALVELKEAERLAAPDDSTDTLYAATAYETLHEIPMAIQYYEKSIATAKKQGTDQERTKAIEDHGRELKATLTPVYLTLTEPKFYTQAALNQLLKQQLTLAEIGLVTNPLAGTPAMDRWAHEIVLGSTNDFQKAQQLFGVIAQNLSLVQSSSSRTAEQVFAAWNAPGVFFSCQENATLYVTLARAVGLKAFLVDVQESWNGNRARHACAAVFLGQKALLADPSYLWFGVPHKQVTVLDDVQAVACHLAQRHDLKLMWIACRLAPDLSLIHLNLIAALQDADRWDEARRELPALVRLDNDGWMSKLERAAFAAHEDKFDQAVDLLQKVIQANPDISAAYEDLGDIYEKQGKLTAARDAYRHALRCVLNPDEDSNVLQALARVDEKLGSKTADTSSDLTEAIQLRPENAEAHRARGHAHFSQREYDKAIDDYSEAIRLDPNDAAAYAGRGSAYGNKQAYDQAIKDFDKALELDPNNANIYRNRGAVYDGKHDHDQAIKDFTEAIRLDSKFARAYFSRGRTYERVGELREAREDYLKALDAELGAKGPEVNKEAVDQTRQAISRIDETLTAQAGHLSASTNVTDEPGRLSARVGGEVQKSGTAAADESKCRANLARIARAIAAYKTDHHAVPNWLSDLVPKYLSDTNALVCPIAQRNGITHPFAQLTDPKIETSYNYEFCPAPMGGIWGGGPLLMRDWKEAEAKLLGDKVPIVRCGLHDRSLNLSVGGQVYESKKLEWEADFQDQVSMADLNPRKLLADQAVALYRREAAKGSAEAAFNLAYMYSVGWGVSKDPVEIARWLRQAAEGGMPAAQLNLAGCYFSGTGVAKDEIEGFKWLYLAAQQGQQEAIKARENWMQRLTATQATEALRRAAEFKPKQGKP